MNKKLYTSYPQARLPDKALPIYKTGGFQGKSRVITNLVLFRWPNGRPCHLVNLWMTHKCLGTAARDSSKTLAGLITHLVSYCYKKHTSFFDFDEDDFIALKKLLVEETIPTATGFRYKRNNNRTGQIQHTTLAFLYWVTSNHPELCTNPIVGLDNIGANITITLKTNYKSGEQYLDHPEIVSAVPYNDDKAPITESTIQILQDEIFRKYDWEELPATSRLKSIKDPELYRASNLYLYERRMFSIRMMKLMGMRPEELYDLDLDLNQNVKVSREIVAFTKKRGTPPPVRRFKIDASAARQFQNYLDARQRYIEFIESRNITVLQPSNIFLGYNGGTLKKESLTKELDRLCEGTKLSGIRVCYSMFRHRFITREINIRLEARFAKTPELKNGWTVGLRDEICREVIVLTGHADPSSLYHYFHSEYNGTTSDSSYSKTLQAGQELESACEELVSLHHQSKLRNLDFSQEVAALQRQINALQELIQKK